MKVTQIEETNPNTQSIRLPHIPSIANVHKYPSDSSVRKRQTLGILSRMFSPFASSTYYYVRSPLESRNAMLHFVML